VGWNRVQIWYLPCHSWCPDWTSVKCRSRRLVHITY
jgi:hypothetical protein